MKNIKLLCVIIMSIFSIFGMEESEQNSYENELKISLQEKKFFNAVETNNIAKVKKLIIDKKKFPLDHQNSEGNTALTIAVKNNYYEMAQELLRQGFNIHKKNKIGQTPLAVAINAKNSEMVSTLLNDVIIKKLGKIDIQDNKGNTPLMLAVKSENPTIVEAILAEVPDYTFKNNKGKTAIDFAQKIEDNDRKNEISMLLYTAQPQFDLYKAITLSKSKKYIKQFIIPDVSLSIKSIERNPLAAAIIMNNIPAFELFIECEVDVNQILRHNLTLLTIALDENNVSMVDLLLQKGANPNGITQILGGITHIYFTLDNDDNDDNSKIRKLLVKYGADVNWPISDKAFGKPSNITPLMMVASEKPAEKCLRLVKELLELRADPSLKNSEGQTALDIITQRVFPDNEIDLQFKIVEILGQAMQNQSIEQTLYKN